MTPKASPVRLQTYQQRTLGSRSRRGARPLAKDDGLQDLARYPDPGQGKLFPSYPYLLW